jgi:ribosomal protein L37AE/L43A
VRAFSKQKFADSMRKYHSNYHFVTNLLQSTIIGYVKMADNGEARRVAKVQCPHCDDSVHAYRLKKGRIMVTTTGGLIAAGVGGAVGSIVGLATGGWGTVATIPFGAAGMVIGSGLGYIVGDQLDKPRCPNCEKEIDLGI